MVTFFPVGGFHIGSSLYKTHTYLSFIDLKLKTSGGLNLVITSDIFEPFLNPLSILYALMKSSSLLQKIYYKPDLKGDDAESNSLIFVNSVIIILIDFDACIW